MRAGISAVQVVEVDPEADPGIKKKMGLNGTAPKETHTHCFSDAFFTWQSKRSTGAISASKSLLYSSKDRPGGMQVRKAYMF